MGIRLLSRAVRVAALAIFAVTACHGAHGHSKPRSAATAAVVDVHVVPHSHCDAGWMLTFEQYYATFVRHILDSTLAALASEPSRRFNWAEVSYMQRWWRDQNATTRASVRELVSSGKLEFVEGGWVQADESVASWHARLDALTLGHEWLAREFGPAARPRTGWKIDPFGATTLTATMFAQDGLDASVKMRIPYAQLKQREANQTMQFLWHTQAPPPARQPVVPGLPVARAPAQDSTLFTHIIESYSAMTEQGFDFDQFRIKSPPVTAANVAARAQVLTSWLHNGSSGSRTSWFRGNILMIPYGGDFRWQNGSYWYGNMSLIFDYVNQRSDSMGFRMRWSTLSEYFDALHAKGLTYSTWGSPFIPYMWRPNEKGFWTGFFSSREELKGASRREDAVLRAAEVMNTWAAVYSRPGYNATAMTAALFPARSASGILQHHDAITGTATQAVVDDYERMLVQGTQAAGQVLATSLAALLGVHVEPPDSAAVEGLRNADRDGPGLSTSSFVVANSVGFGRAQYVEIPAPAASLPGTTWMMHVPGQPGSRATPVCHVDGALLRQRGYATATVGVHVPAMGAIVVSMAAVRIGASPEPWLRSLHSSSSGKGTVVTCTSSAVAGTGTPLSGATANITNGVTTAVIDAATGHLTAVVDSATGVRTAVDQAFLTYRNNSGSGAYIFAPNRTAAVPFPQAGTVAPPTVAVHRTPLYQEAMIVFNQTLVQRLRVYNYSAVEASTFTRALASVVEIQVNIGPVPFRNNVITRFTTTIDNAGVLYPDNGLFAAPWNGTEAVADFRFNISGSYRPAVNGAAIADRDARAYLTLLSSQSFGVASLRPGELEFMVFRDVGTDGLGPPCNDTAATTETWWLLAGAQPAPQAWGSLPGPDVRRLSLALNFPLVVASASVDRGGQASPSRVFAPLVSDMPPSVQLLTLQMRQFDATQGPSPLLRFVNVGDQHVTVPFGNGELFADLHVEDATATTLTGNLDLSELNRTQWPVAGSGVGGIMMPVVRKAGHEASATPTSVRVQQVVGEASSVAGVTVAPLLTSTLQLQLALRS